MLGPLPPEACHLSSAAKARRHAASKQQALIDVQERLDRAIPAMGSDRLCAERLAPFFRGGWILQQTFNLCREGGPVAAWGVHPEITQDLSADFGVERYRRQSHGDVIQQFAVALGLGQLG